ncbi:hypothetical protein DFJ74DRAFT_686535 [Hyaloraphidium curvatum]|nr:hypothetical protein DFJ74DRAFT_686535 [Hyaloraphidium curvatum]
MPPRREEHRDKHHNAHGDEHGDEHSEPIFGFCPDSMQSTGPAACARCGLPSPKLFACGACKSAWYCSKPCQVAAWAEHKSLCSASRFLLDFALAALAQPLRARPNGSLGKCPQIQLRDDEGPEDSMALWMFNQKVEGRKKDRESVLLFLWAKNGEVPGQLEIFFEGKFTEGRRMFMPCPQLSGSGAAETMMRSLDLDISRGLVRPVAKGGEQGVWAAFPGLQFTSDTSVPQRNALLQDQVQGARVRTRAPRSHRRGPRSRRRRDGGHHRISSHRSDQEGRFRAAPGASALVPVPRIPFLGRQQPRVDRASRFAALCASRRPHRVFPPAQGGGFEHIRASPRRRPRPRLEPRHRHLPRPRAQGMGDKAARRRVEGDCRGSRTRARVPSRAGGMRMDGGKKGRVGSHLARSGMTGGDVESEALGMLARRQLVW